MPGSGNSRGSGMLQKRRHVAADVGACLGSVQSVFVASSLVGAGEAPRHSDASARSLSSGRVLHECCIRLAACCLNA
jgi:hypothetical protein